MDLPIEQVQSTIRFLERYANTALAEMTDLLDVADRTDEAREDLSSRGDQDQLYTVIADAASALREAGQWSLYLDPERARNLLMRSGRLFHGMGQAFGTYLLVVASIEDPPLDLFSEPLATLTGAPRTDESSLWVSPLRHPQQQAYLLLAASGTRRAYRNFGSGLNGLMGDSVQRHGVLPVGALGTPIRRFWEVARHLYNDFPNSVDVIARHLAAMCGRYAETMELAQVNAHLWRHGAAPVDVGDIDIAGIAAITARKYGGEALLTALDEVGLRLDRDRIALAPVEAGITLAEPRRHGPRGVDN